MKRSRAFAHIIALLPIEKRFTAFILLIVVDLIIAVIKLIFIYIVLSK